VPARQLRTVVAANRYGLAPIVFCTAFNHTWSRGFQRGLHGTPKRCNSHVPRHVCCPMPPHRRAPRAGSILLGHGSIKITEKHYAL
jgi:hypothetical protein